MIVNEIFGFSKRSNNSSYTNNPYAVMSQPEPELEPVPADEPDAEPAPASAFGNMSRQLGARGQSQTSTGGATIATGRGIRHAASPLNPNQLVNAPAAPSLELMKKATASLQGGSALSAQELKQVNDYRVTNGAKPIPAQTSTSQPAAPATTPTSQAQPAVGSPASFNASNVMKMPGMEKYAKPGAPAKAPSFAGPSGYGSVSTSFKPPALTKRLQAAESLTWSKDFDPGMSLLRKMRK